jgi:hypothetical protein
MALVGLAARTGRLVCLALVVLVPACREPNPAFVAKGDASALPMTPDVLAPDTPPAVVDVAESRSDGDGGTMSPAALLIVHRPADLDGTDTQLLAVLAEQRFTVTVRAAAIVSEEDARGMSLIFVAPSTRSEEYGARLKDVVVPTIVGEPYLFDDLGFSGGVEGTDYGEGPGQDVQVIAPDHPLAGGQAGTLMALDHPDGTIGWGVPGPSAVIVARHPQQATRATLFAYEAGATMVAGPARARRVALFSSGQLGRATYTPAALEMVRAAVRWAAAH